MIKFFRKRALLTLALSLTTAAVFGDDIFTPSRKSSFRMPSTPILVNDPYFSIWSPADKLYASSTKHWSDADKPITGVLRVDGKCYRFLGKNPDIAIAPVAKQKRWHCKYLISDSGIIDGGWMLPGYDDSAWKSGNGAFGDRGEGNGCATAWGKEGTDVYVRRTVNIDNTGKYSKYILQYSHDDVCEIYINGKEIINTGNTWKDDQSCILSESQKALLKNGENIIAAHCHNTTGGAFLDFGLSGEPDENQNAFTGTATQISATTLATSSYYTFKCGPVVLDLVFTSPQLIDDLDLLSTPINYISYRVTATDKNTHDVSMLLYTTPEIARNTSSQPVESSSLTSGGIRYLKTGTIDQPYMARRGDLICQDWGYFYLSASNSDQNVSLCKADDLEKAFSSGAALPVSIKNVRSYDDTLPVLAFCHKFSPLSSSASQSGFTMAGYDDVWSLIYLYEPHKAYWTHGGKVTIFDAFEKMRSNYDEIMRRARELDKKIYDDAFKSGGREYAEICSGAYRQVMAAHKLITDNEGRLLYFSKENNSNGSVNTVDLTYPSAPLFLIYNPTLEKAMMTAIFESSKSGRWHKPFPQHDMGTYPQANGQTYGGDMPIEEGGNMLILSAELSRLDGNTAYLRPYMDLLRIWADYLVANGQDPENQLCTDDFAGHWAHNANLSIKAIMGVAGYALICGMDGNTAERDKYMSKAKEMAEKWEKAASDGDHYRLSFDHADTWSQKYNLVWDKIWNTNIFSPDVMKKEIKFYLKKQNIYGLPLDCRMDYTKSDWIMWTATMAPDKKTFEKFISPVYKFYGETVDRVPMSDWFQTKEPNWVSFRARSVIGGFWMKVFADMQAKKH